MEYLVDYLVGTGLALIFLLISWAYGRALSAGRPLNAFKRRLLAYGFIFVLGTCYLMALVRELGWPKDLLWPMLVAWGALVALVAWWRYRRRKTSEASRERTQNRS